jgi:hypothetical protein
VDLSLRLLSNKRLELSGPRTASAAAGNDILLDAAASAWAPQLKRDPLGNRITRHDKCSPQKSGANVVSAARQRLGLGSRLRRLLRPSKLAYVGVRV